MAEFMFQNVVYRATVYRNGVEAKSGGASCPPCPIFPPTALLCELDPCQKKQEQKQKQQQLSGKKGQSLSPCDAKRVTDFRNF